LEQEKPADYPTEPFSWSLFTLLSANFHPIKTKNGGSNNFPRLPQFNLKLLYDYTYKSNTFTWQSQVFEEEKYDKTFVSLLMLILVDLF